MEYAPKDLEDMFEIPDIVEAEPRHTRIKRRAAEEGGGDRFTFSHKRDSRRRLSMGASSAVFYNGRISTEPRSERVAKRPIPKTPFKVLDAPAVINDYYLNIMDWSPSNVIGLGLKEHLYLWNADTRKVSPLAHAAEGQYVSSVSFSRESVLAAGYSNGEIEIYDIEKERAVRKLRARRFRVPSLSWGSGVLSSGGRDGAIFNHDVRAEDDHISSFLMHTQEVCGLQWDPEGTCLASGSNDNAVGVWRLGSVRPKEKFEKHTAAVRALAWCPWKRGVLATGGGTKDKSIKAWDVERGCMLSSVDSGSQVCGLLFSERYKELISTHGYAENDIRVWKFCSMRVVGKMSGHEDRVLYSALSPGGGLLATCAADENLNLWMLFEKSGEGRQPKGEFPMLR
jgi:cell division cycle 20, cofactor of APC complex